MNSKIETYRAELTLEFKDKTAIGDLKHQIDKVGARLEKVFSQQPELEGTSVAETDFKYTEKKHRRGVRPK